MNIRCLRFAVRAAVCVVLAAAGLSCDALNPTFVNQIGGAAVQSVPEPNGSIAVVFNNQRPTSATLAYTITTTPPSGTSITTTVADTNLGGYPLIATYDCNTTKIAITGVSLATTTQPSTTQTSDTTTTGVPVALTATFQAPNLQCGSVIFVNIPILGSPTVSIVP
jgi:hypothetical protein